jgi:arylsulfatase A-like enzyme
MRAVMHNRLHLRGAGLVAVAVVVAVAGGLAIAARSGENTRAATAPTGKHLNVLVVFTDDQDAPSVRVMDTVRSRLAVKGTTFSNAFATLPQCCPSRATLLTGQYAHNHGVRDNDPPHGGFAAFDDSNTLPVWLQGAGYRTGWIGKYLNGYGNSNLGNDPLEIPPGWSSWVAPVNHTEYRMYGYTLNRNGELRDYGAGPRSYQTDVLAREATGFIRDGKGDGRPFFLTVAPLAPHQEGGRLDDRPAAPRNPRPAPRDLGRFERSPLPRPPSFNERRDGDKTWVVTNEPRLDRDQIGQLTKLYRSRLESLLAVDELVGRLLGTLRKTGQLRDTLVIFTSDQGFLLGEHHLIGKNRLYEEAVKVPLIIRGPGIEAGAERDELVGNVDLAPTIAAAAGVTPQASVDGNSLLERGAPLPRAGRRQLLLEQYHGGRFAGVRGRRYVYLDFGNRGLELYDLRRDPFQLRNLASQPTYAPVRDRYASRLEQLRSCSGAECR